MEIYEVILWNQKNRILIVRSVVNTFWQSREVRTEKYVALKEVIKMAFIMAMRMHFTVMNVQKVNRRGGYWSCGFQS